MTINHYDDIAVFGAGSWGTALACHISGKQKKVDLFLRNKIIFQEITDRKTNSRYLPNVKLPSNIIPHNDYRYITGKQVLILALPSEVLDSDLKKLFSKLDPETILLIATKGLASSPAGLFSSKISLNTNNPLAFISGPNLALELTRGLLTSFTIASENLEIAKKLQLSLESPNFIGSITDDIITVQVAGAVKNIIAIYSGMRAAQGAGENARAYIITQGIEEILTISKALGGNGNSALTTPGVLGDLVLTCYSTNSRNTKFGYKLAQATNKTHFLKSYSELVEGRFAAIIMNEIMIKYDLKLPIISSVIKELKIQGNIVN